MNWISPNKNCGVCGLDSCDAFITAVKAGIKDVDACPYYTPQEPQTDFSTCGSCNCTAHTGADNLGVSYDFIISALPNEPSMRKIALPFRPEIVEKLGITTGDVVLGRPTGAGCPIQHVMRVLTADPVSGLITGHVVGPAFARGNANVIDLKHYHMIGFEGIANVIRRAPELGLRMSFLPGSCMAQWTHTGVVNMIMQKPYGLHVRVEGIVIQ